MSPALRRNRGEESPWPAVTTKLIGPYLYRKEYTENEAGGITVVRTIDGGNPNEVFMPPERALEVITNDLADAWFGGEWDERPPDPAPDEPA